MKRTACACAALLLAVSLTSTAHAAGKLNVLLITVDDMNYDSLGATGCKVKGSTPNLDKLAKQGMLFQRAHVTIAVCQPTRAVWMTGLYPHKNGARGFERIKQGIPTLPEILSKHSFFLGLIGKTTHVVPSRRKAWDMIVGWKNLRWGRDPELYYKYAKTFFDDAKESGKPFFLMANSHDPHRPFAGSDQEKGSGDKKKKRQKRRKYPEVRNPYLPRDVEVPGFLPDLPKVRLEIAEYYTSVRRADAIAGAILRALTDSGLDGNTIVMFLSDHGMALPFAKTNCYYHSTRTPWIVRWPGITKPGSTDSVHFVSGIDLMPTVLDALGIAVPKDLSGKSFVPVLRGNKQENRDKLYTVFHKTSARRTYEMRAAHNDRYLYIFNDWSDGKTEFRNESQNGRTMTAMVKAAKSQPRVAARVELFLYRVPQELYDIKEDPDCLNNLVDDPKHEETLQRLQRQMLGHMLKTKDPLVANFKRRIREAGPSGQDASTGHSTHAKPSLE